MGRRYDERDVGLILKRVAELHDKEGSPTDARSMTKGELEDVVGELGISKALVTRAISEMSVQDVRNRPVWWLGGKKDLMFEEVVEGHIDEATLTQMIEVLRRNLGDPGELKRDGATRIWSLSGTSGRPVHLTLVEHGDRTTIRLEENMLSSAGATVTVGTFVGGLGGFLTVVPLKALVIKAVLLMAMGPLTLVGATLGWLAGRALWKRQSRTQEAELRQMFGEISSAAGQTAPAALTEVDERSRSV